MSDDRGERVALASGSTTPGHATTLALEAHPTTVSAALALGSRIAALRTSALDQWEALATLASRDLGIARAIEPVIDAGNIFVEAALQSEYEGPVPALSSWGVFAAEGGNDPLVATPAGAGWSLTGTKPWCSLAGELDFALVTATTADGERMLFSVDLRAAGITTDSASWQARGLVEIPSGPVTFAATPAEPVGAPGWYLSRPGFAVGGIGVAACWFGGAVGIARTVRTALAARTASDIQLMHLGAIDELVHTCRAVLADAATVVDSGSPTRGELSILAKRARATVARAAEEIIVRAGHALGPAPLALDAEHAKRVADLTLYVRQHHAEKDQASLGSAVLALEVSPW